MGHDRENICRLEGLIVCVVRVAVATEILITRACQIYKARIDFLSVPVHSYIQIASINISRHCVENTEILSEPLYLITNTDLHSSLSH